MGADDTLKRAVDIVGASVALVVLSPLLALVALVVRIRMGSPVLFRQERPGRDGRRFLMTKFRTMTDRRAADGSLLPDAERLTRFGRFLRRTSIDELPELLNVVRGDMSLVGPRPLLMEYLPLYSPEQARRHEARPGITGWAQVNGRNAVTWEEKFALDVWYVDHRSTRLDFEILVKTIAQVFGGHGVERAGPRDHGALPGGCIVSRVIVIGGSDQGRQVIDTILAGGSHTAVGVLDRGLARGADVSGVPVLGSDDELHACAAAIGADGYVIAIGDNATRGRILEHTRTASPHLEPATIVHPAAVIAHDATVGAGSIVLAGAVVANGCSLGMGVLLGVQSSIDHDGIVADHASLGPGAITGGNVRIGRTTAIGLGANLIHGITVGDDAVIGAGALVLNDMPARVVAYGVPARIARSREPGEPYLERR